MFVSQIFDEASEILGTTDSTRIFRKLTQAVQTLMESGHWLQTNAEMDICTGWDGVTITLPREIDVPLAVNVDGSPLYFRNRLFQYHINKGGINNSVEWAWDDRGYVATMMDIIQPSQLIAVAESDNDVGKLLRVVGTNSNNRQIRSQTDEGVGVDGLLLPIHSQTDFQYGTITPDGGTVRSRHGQISPLGLLTSTTPHTLNSGEQVLVSMVSGSIPTPLKSGQNYYVGVVDAYSVRLYNDSLNAQVGNYPIAFQSIVGAGQMLLQDLRPSQVVTALQLTSAPLIAVSTANPIYFPNQLLPAPLQTGPTYYANLIGPQTLQIFKSVSDAENNVNPVYTTGSTAQIQVDIRKEIAPQTQFDFGVDHFFTTGDQVQATSNGGVLPQPLITGTNYYVRVITARSLTLHNTAADALTGNDPINCITSGSGTNSLVRLIPGSVSVGTQSNILASGLNLPLATGSGATAKAVPSGIITGTSITNGGGGYTTNPAVTITDVGGAGYIQNQVTVEIDGAFTSPATFNVTVNSSTGFIQTIAVTNPGSGYQPNAQVTIKDSSNAQAGRGAQATITGLDQNGGISGIQLNPVGTGGVITATYNSVNGQVNALIISNPGEGYVVPPRITIAAPTGASPIQATGLSTITTSFLEYIEVRNGGINYGNAPAVTITGGGGNGATATAIIENGVVTKVNVITKGTGYSSSPNVIFTPSTGVFVSFSTTGSFPTPLTQGASYRAEQPFSASSFTIVNNDYSPVNITSVGTGQLFVLLSRPFSVGFTNRWKGDYSGLSTPTAVYFGSDYNLPNTNPPIDNGGTQFFLNIDPNNQFARVYTTSANASAGGTAGLIDVTDFGTGQAYYAVRSDCQPLPYNNLIAPSYISFLEDGEVVEFSTSGTLPTGILANTDYTIKLVGSDVQVYLNNVLVNITTPGIGRLSMDIVRTMNVVPSTSIEAVSSLYETGTMVAVRPSENDTLPTGLVSGTDYFVRRINSNEFELYNSRQNAIVLTSTTGRIQYTSSGNEVDSFFHLDAVTDPIFVKTISAVQKPITDGYVSLYAYDYGRTNDMTLIGQYHPTEINPQYRRIRIGKRCAWARIIYRSRPPVISSLYDFIPVEQERAILAAVHACDLEDKDFADQATRYWGIALQYLKNQQDSQDGHAMSPPQINNITYGDGTDPVMT
jgi:hypothetical protein